MTREDGHRLTPEDAVRQVALACRILARYGQEDLTLGHASVRGPDGGTVFIKRKGKALRDVCGEEVIGIALGDPDGHLTPGAHLETIMHLETYRARPDVGAVIHTHPLYSIALGATAGGLDLLSHDGLLFPDGVPVFDGTAGLVTTPREGQGVARGAGRRPGGAAAQPRHPGGRARHQLGRADRADPGAGGQDPVHRPDPRRDRADPARGGPRAVGQQVPGGVRRRVLAGLVPHARQPGMTEMVRATINGKPCTAGVPAEELLLDFLRDRLGLTGTKQSCEVQVCGVCTVLVDGDPVKFLLLPRGRHRRP